jgi:hypothetical protein
MCVYLISTSSVTNTRCAPPGKHQKGSKSKTNAHVIDFDRTTTKRTRDLAASATISVAQLRRDHKLALLTTSQEKYQQNEHIFKYKQKQNSAGRTRHTCQEDPGPSLITENNDGHEKEKNEQKPRKFRPLMTLP